jgi:WD40 repeat protein/tetratricopeptide (TPR) repeat protein
MVYVSWPYSGQRLYHSLFGSVGAQDLVQVWQKQAAVRHQISLVSDLPAVLSLPWELLCDEHGFLVLRQPDPVSFVRRLLQHEQTLVSTPYEPPLRVLLVTARPKGAGFVDPRSIARELLDEIQAQVEAGTIEVEFLRPATVKELETRLRDQRRPPIHVLHFDGHGVFSKGQNGQGEGILLFEKSEGGRNPVKASRLATVLQEGNVRMAVLTACQSAISASDNAFSSAAAQLIRGGVDAVIAMSASVLVVSASRYAEAFYRALAAGTPASMAHERARRALHDDPRRHPHHRRRDEEGIPVELRDWWLPHFYQQHPLFLQPTQTDRSGKIAQQSLISRRLNEDMPGVPRYGFNGRAYELHQIERSLLRRRLVVIHGFGGIGKTALAREAADWLTRTGMYDGACFVSFEHGGDAATLLRALGSHLNVYDGHYNPDDPEAALARLGPALKIMPTLVLADDVESNLPSGAVPLEATRRLQLWDVLLQLKDRGAGVLLTSRDTAFSESRLLARDQVTYLPLAGLDAESAYALASRLLEELDIDRARVPYVGLCDLLRQLDYHPLAIQLVLPKLRQLPLSTITTEFAALLPTFVDARETGRNASLLASLAYSVRRLDRNQQALLPRLAFFEGGALEENLLAITGIPADEWAGLRSALEQSSLLTLESVYKTIPGPFLHFHPVLAPFLRGLPGADDSALRMLFAKRYYALVEVLQIGEIHDPQGARTLFWRELANIQRALYLLLEAGELADASKMVGHISKFLTILGLNRERDEMWQQATKAGAVATALTGEELTWEAYQRERGTGENEPEFGDFDFNSAMTQNTLKSLGELGMEGLKEWFEEQWRRDTEVQTDERTSMGQALAREEYQREVSMGEYEWTKRDLRAASTRFTNLLARIEARAEGSSLGNGSYEHSVVLSWLALCLTPLGQPAAAEERLREAIAITDALTLRLPDQTLLVRHRGIQLGDLAGTLVAQGKYSAAGEAYEEALEIVKQVGDVRLHVTTLEGYGGLAVRQGDYAVARSHYTSALGLLGSLDDPQLKASLLYELGGVAIGQQQWAEAQEYYRDSLEIKERLEDVIGVATVCSQLAIVAENTKHLEEAEGWLKRAIELDKRVRDSSPEQSSYLTNLANLLVNAVREDRVPRERLAEARNYAEQALTIDEKLEASLAIWHSLHALASIAEIAGRREEAQAYRHRALRIFADFEGNRFDVERVFGAHIILIVTAAIGRAQAVAELEELMAPVFREVDANLPATIQRILAGERNWYALAEDLTPLAALLVLRVLEMLAELHKVMLASVPDFTRQKIEALPPEKQQLVGTRFLKFFAMKDDILETEQRQVGGQTPLAALESLSPEKQQVLQEQLFVTLQALQAAEREVESRPFASVSNEKQQELLGLLHPIAEALLPGRIDEEVKEEDLLAAFNALSSEKQQPIKEQMRAVLNALSSVEQPGMEEINHLEAPANKEKPGTLLSIYRGHTAAVSALAWLPDGRRIVSGSNDTTVKLWDAASSKTLTVYPYREPSFIARVVLHRSSFQVKTLALSPDGQRIAAGDGGGTVRVWHVEDGGRVSLYRRHSNKPVQAVAWSPSGEQVASAGEDGTVQIRDTTDGRHPLIYRGHTGLVKALAWSPVGKRIASAGADGTVQVWAASSGSHIATYYGHTAAVFALAWSPDGQHIASASADSTVQVWEAAHARHRMTYQGHPASVFAVAWSPNGKCIASAGVNGNIQIWDATDGSHIFTFRGHTEWVTVLAWSPDGSLIASAGADKTVRVWWVEATRKTPDSVTRELLVTLPETDVVQRQTEPAQYQPASSSRPAPTSAGVLPGLPPRQTPPSRPLGTRLYTYRGHTHSVNAVVWSPDGKHIASASADQTVQVWDATDGSHASVYRGHTLPVEALAWSPDNKRIVSASADQTVQVWDAADGSHVFTYGGHSNQWVDAVAWSPDGTCIVSAGSDHTVQVWDAADGGHVYTYRGHDERVEALAWSPDSKRIASADSNGVAQVWGTMNGGNVLVYNEHDSTIRAIAWSPDGKRIASAGDGTVQVWDATTGEHLCTYRRHLPYEVVAVTWSPDGKYIASGARDGTVHIWAAADERHIYTYRGHFDHVQAVAWSADGACIASCSRDKTVQVWAAEGIRALAASNAKKMVRPSPGALLCTYHGHAQKITAVQWSPHGKRIASASMDGTVQVWDAATGNTISIYRGHAGPVRALSWLRGGEKIASGGDDTTVQVWEAGTSKQIFTYRGHTTKVKRVSWWSSSHGGSGVVSVGEDGIARTWEDTTGKLVATTHEQTHPITPGVKSPNGKFIAYEGDDGTVQIRDAKTGSSVLIYRGHSGAVTIVTWSRDGKRIASVDDDTTIQVWRAR